VAVIEPLPPALLDARSRELAAARRAAAAEQVERARAALRFATNELQRFQRLFAEGTVSIQELEVAQWRAEAAARELGVAEGALREAEAALAEFGEPAGGAAPARSVTEVRAPASGCVLRVLDPSARVVSAGAPLLEVGDPADLEVVIEMLSRDGAALAPGTPVELDQWGGPQVLQARVRRVEPAAFTKVSALGVEEQRVNVIADLVSPPEARRGLGDGYRVEARVVVWEADAVVRVPSGALFRRGGEWAAFVVEEGRARLRAVKAGRAGAQDVQVLEGLQPGETVILHPGNRLRDGQRVKPVQL
jgi:HlyD family secretion protein